MFTRTSMLWGPLMLTVLGGCAAHNPLQSLATPQAVAPRPNQAATAAPPVANETSKVLASIAIERVTGETRTPVALVGDR